jgi:hypothetical protein
MYPAAAVADVANGFELQAGAGARERSVQVELPVHAIARQHIHNVDLIPGDGVRTVGRPPRGGDGERHTAVLPFTRGNDGSHAGTHRRHDAGGIDGRDGMVVR